MIILTETSTSYVSLHLHHMLLLAVHVSKVREARFCAQGTELARFDLLDGAQ